jgi:hypothetical protein
MGEEECTGEDGSGVARLRDGMSWREAESFGSRMRTGTRIGMGWGLPKYVHGQYINGSKIENLIVGFAGGGSGKVWDGGEDEGREAEERSDKYLDRVG